MWPQLKWANYDKRYEAAIHGHMYDELAGIFLRGSFSSILVDKLGVQFKRRGLSIVFSKHIDINRNGYIQSEIYACMNI